MQPSHNGDAESLVVDSRLTLQQREYLLAAVLTLPALYLRAKQTLKVNHFSLPDERHLRIAWSAMTTLGESIGDNNFFTDREGSLAALVVELSRLHQLHPASVSAEVLQRLCDPVDGYLPQVFRQCKPEQFSTEHVRKILAAFLVERDVQDQLATLMLQADDLAVTNLHDVLTRLAEKSHRYRAVGATSSVKPVAVPGWRPTRTVPRSLGVPFVDRMCGGGLADGETFAILGGFGAGKSILAIQIVASVGAEELHKSSDLTYKPKYAYYFHWEMPEDVVRARFYSHAAYVPYDRVINLSAEDFSLADAPAFNSEHLDQLHSVIGPLANVPERDRFHLANEKLRYTRQVNLGSDPHNPSVGKGHLSEVAALLHEEKSEGREPAIVVLDYAHACVRQHTADKDLQYELLTTFCGTCQKLIGVPFNVGVVVMHQLSGTSNARSVSSTTHYTDAAGSKSFAENADFAGEMVIADVKRGVRKFSQSKARRTEPVADPLLLRVVGPYMRLVDVSDQFMLNPHNLVVPKAHADIGLNEED